jgi:threonine dehydrogenase-like Zn-dependent dehydrogenase
LVAGSERGDGTIRGAVMYGPGDVRVEERAEPRILAPTDAILRLSATCICGSDLWPWRGVDDYGWPQASNKVEPAASGQS